MDGHVQGDRMKVGLYARVSTDKQDTDNQMIRLREVAQNRGYEVFDEYVDIASGRNANRPNLDRMMKDAKQHRFDKIIAVKLDRIARSVTNLNNLMNDLYAWNVGIEFIDQPIDTTTPAGKMILTILGAMAEFERELIVERTNDGLKRARKEGKTLGRKTVTLSEYQLDKARSILKDNPNISMNALSKQFTGISRNTLIKCLKEEGLVQ